MNMKYFLCCLIGLSGLSAWGQAWIRINQYGYFPQDKKVAIVQASEAPKGKFQLVDAETGTLVYTGKVDKSTAEPWGSFLYYELDFSEVKTPGRYQITLDKAEIQSSVFQIGTEIYYGTPEDLLAFMRQQRCGYNPFLDLKCHQQDGRSMYGPMPDSTIVDATGGWHDAGDQLKYLITASNATARMLLSYELYPEQFADLTDAFGKPTPNGLPDVLDEARWGLDWIFKLHPTPRQLIHQVADDRDHRGWKMPNEDPSDYGWGPNSYRVAYFANGQPQGLGKYPSEATGLSNLAGRSAAAMALGARVFKAFDAEYAAKCLTAARSLYALGKAREGFQQGNSFGAPYRYSEDTWTDDMEWGAAELYTTTRIELYRTDAIRFARMPNNQTSWMDKDTSLHYRFYPFVNVGHFALYRSVDNRMKAQLATYYREGIEYCLARASQRPFQVGVPFIWCSNHLVSALITQIILYEEMTGDRQYHEALTAHRDWLWGTNPWGTSMFTQMPRTGEYPLDIHTSVWMMTHREVPGGLIDGPLRQDIHDRQLGIAYAEADEFAAMQNGVVVYHDDNGDYATNEPTMDGTADALLMMAHWSRGE